MVVPVSQIHLVACGWTPVVHGRYMSPWTPSHGPQTDHGVRPRRLVTRLALLAGLRLRKPLVELACSSEEGFHIAPGRP